MVMGRGEGGGVRGRGMLVEGEDGEIWMQNREMGSYLRPLPARLQSRAVPCARCGDDGDGGREDDASEGGGAVGRGGHCGCVMVVDSWVGERSGGS